MTDLTVRRYGRSYRYSLAAAAAAADLSVDADDVERSSCMLIPSPDK